MTYITARFGVPVAKPKPLAQKRQPLTEAELADKWMELAIKEGRVKPPKVEPDPKALSGQLVARIFDVVSDVPASANEIAEVAGVSTSSAWGALRILRLEGKATYSRKLVGRSRVRMWVRV